MFGCCNNLFSNTCRCNNGGTSCGGGVPSPIPVFPPMPPTPTPTPPAPQLRGFEATFTAGAGATVADGFPIPFNNLVSNNVLGASFVTGAVILNRPGTYLVNWWVAMGEQGDVATQGAGGPSQIGFSTTLNGAVVSTSYAPCGTGQISGSALVTAQSTPATLQIVNGSGENVVLASTTTQAGVVVTQLA
ncbi:MAG: hypothetical protein IJT69_00735 [Clostridia bacterium]|nr:hypothetical protein [Clostridia bacterium]